MGSGVIRVVSDVRTAYMIAQSNTDFFAWGTLSRSPLLEPLAFVWANTVLDNNKYPGKGKGERGSPLQRYGNIVISIGL